MSSEVNVPVTVKLLIVGFVAKPTSIWLSVTVVCNWLVVPVIVSVSPPAKVSVVPLSAAISKPVAIVAVVAAVTKPLALTVRTGICVAEPTEPTSLLTVANVVLNATAPVPSKETAAAVASPVTLKLRALASAVAVSALPVTSPVTLPVRSPVTSPVRSPVNPPLAETVVPTTAPVRSPVTSPLKSPIKLLFAVIVEPTIVLALLAPIAVPSMAPPSISTAVLSCVAIEPNPKFVLAPAAVVAPVPPLTTANDPDTKLLSLMSIAPAVTVPLLT